jgi:predicted RNA-binding Zn ribbon-like protein
MWLDPGDYDGTYKPVGGEPSLDLVNTVSWLGSEREHDWFDRPGNVVAWSAELGLIDGGAAALLRRRLKAQPAQVTDELHQVHKIRAALRAVLSPLVHDEPPPAGAVDGLNKLLRQVRRGHVVDPQTLRRSWDPATTLVEAVAPVIDNAAHVLTDTDHSRLGHCPACGWLFLDTSRNRSRRWCDMADCGSRDKALRYYHRTREPR